MTWMSRIVGRWFKAPSPSPHVSPQPREGRSRPRVPAAYLPLYTYLEHRYAEVAFLTFEQIESLLGFSLPDEARTDVAWWNGDRPAAAHTQTWTLAHRSAKPNLSAETVAFERAS